MWSIHWLIDWLIASFATRSVWTRTHRHQSPTRMERSVSPLRPLDISRPSIFTQWSAVAVSPLVLNVVLYAFHEQYYQQANCALVSLHSVLAVVFWLLYVCNVVMPQFFFGFLFYFIGYVNVTKFSECAWDFTALAVSHFSDYVSFCFSLFDVHFDVVSFLLPCSSKLNYFFDFFLECGMISTLVSSKHCFLWCLPRKLYDFNSLFLGDKCFFDLSLECCMKLLHLP